MATRSIVVRLRAEVDGFKREMAEATRAVDQTAKGTETAAKQADTAMGRMVQSAKENSQAWNTAGTTLAGFGAAALGGLGLATKAAMGWESAWAGVQKTVDGTAPQMAALEQGLRGMARELPASHQEIAAVAEAAGQLGIAIPNVLSFTRTMIDLGESTNMSADEAATALARFMNITQTSQQDVGRLGASIVGLGNNFATTESEIVDMSMRLAGAGAQAGLTEGEILGMAAAMSSVGIEAEAGGTAMSTTMKRIGKAVDEGGESLDLFAQVSGMSSEQFAAAWETRPAEALNAFIAGLSQTEQMGMSTNAVLTELGITGIRESDALLRLSSATGLAAEAMAMGNDEWEKGSALIEEASKRYETAESRIAIAKNALVDAGISIGGVVLPAFAELADGVADAAGWFADLPAPVHGTIAALGGIAGAAALGAGSFLLLAPRVLDTVSAFRDLGAISPATASKVGRVTLGIGKLGLGIGAAAAAFPALNSLVRGLADEIEGINRAELDLGMNEAASALMEASRSGDAFNAILGDLYESGAVTTSVVGDLGEAVQKVAFLETGDGIEGWFARVGNSANLTRRDLQSLQDRFSELGEALVMMAQTDLAMAQDAFAGMWAEMSAGGATFDEVMTVLPGFKDHLVGVAEQMGVGTDNATLLKIATGELSPVVNETTGAVEGYTEAVEGAGEETATAADQVDELQEKMFALADGFLNARQAARDYEDSLVEAKKVLDENGKAWGDSTEAARENGAALDDVSQSVLDNAEAMKRNGEDVGGYLESQREILWNLARDFGATEEEATAYVDALGLVPSEIETLIELETQAAKDQWNTLWSELGHHPPEVPVTADTDPAKGEVQQFSGTLGDMPPGHVPVDADTGQAERKVNTFGQKVGETPTGDVPIGADTSPAEQELHVFGSRAGDYSATVIIDADTYYGEEQLRAFQGAVNGAGGTVTINGESMNGQQALAALVTEINAGGGYVDINGTPVNAEAALLQLTDHINNSGGTVDIDGNKVPAELKTGQVKKQIDGTEGTVTIDGNNNPANQATDSAKRKADGTTGTIDVNANTGGAESSINRTARNRSSTINANAATWSAENQLNWLARNRTSTITVRTSGAGGGVRAQLAYATGGPVHGPGTGTSDSIAALLSNGEHVLTAAEVALAGGHDSIFRMRSAIRAGALRFAEGGGVESGGYAAAPAMVSVSSMRPQTVSASVDTSGIGPAVAQALSGMSVSFKAGRSEIRGVMEYGAGPRGRIVVEGV